jgi:hypothetical protein
MPPTIEMWMSVPRLSAIVLIGFYNYFLMPVQFILSLAVIRQVLSSIREFTGKKTK